MVILFNKGDMKKSKLIHYCLGILFLTIACIASLDSEAQNNKDENGRVTKEFYNESSLRITFIKGNIVHIQLIPKSKSFKESGLNRYKFIDDKPDIIPKVDINSDKSFSLESPTLKVVCNGKTGEILITSVKSKKVLLDQTRADFPENYSYATFKAEKDEDWLGFGDQTRKRLYQRGFIADCNVTEIKSYNPVPFFMSTKGVGVLVNTTYHIVFDMCKTDSDQYSWKDSRICIH